MRIIDRCQAEYRMRITREKLLKLSESYVQQRSRKDRSIQCAYLTGSLLREYPFINGTTDVDIIMIHSDLAQAYREVTGISEEATFDIYHYPKSYFANPRNLRTDPWIGSSLCFDPVVLFGKGHWYEFVLSSVEASFFLPENIMQRALVFNNNAHRYFYQLQRLANSKYETTYVFNYLLCIENAVNSVACLSKKPLTMRHFLQDFNECCAEVGNTSLVSETEKLFTDQTSIEQHYTYYYQFWNYYFDYFSNYVKEDFFPEYGKFRHPYYTKAVEAFWEAHLPSAIWIMLNTWTHIFSAMNMENNESFHSFLGMNGLTPAQGPKRLEEIDHFLEHVDDTIDNWGKSHGIEDGTSIYLE